LHVFLEDLCFHRDKFPESLYTGDLYNRVLLALGSVVHKLSKAGDKNRATAITVYKDSGNLSLWKHKSSIPLIMLYNERRKINT
jgi:hypothetical protein